jgi:hypothetical protein
MQEPEIQKRASQNGAMPRFMKTDATQIQPISKIGVVRPNAVNLIENARSSHEWHETISLSVAPFLALFVYFVQFVAVLLLCPSRSSTLS